MNKVVLHLITHCEIIEEINPKDLVFHVEGDRYNT